MIRRVLLFAIFSGLLTVTTAQVFAQSADEIIARNITARGGAEKIKAVQSQQLLGTISFSPEDAGPFQVEIRRPNKMRQQFSVHGKVLMQVTDGKQGWVINPVAVKGEVVALDAAGLKNMEGGATAIDGPLLNYRQKGNKVELLGKEDVEGKPAYKLRITEADGKVRHDFIDCTSYLEVKWEGNVDAAGKAGVQTFFHDYRSVAGVMFSFLMNSDSAGAYRQTIKFDKIEVNTIHDDRLFGKPLLPAADAAKSANSAKN